jgi:hypothetical protein
MYKIKQSVVYAPKHCVAYPKHLSQKSQARSGIVWRNFVPRFMKIVEEM